MYENARGRQTSPAPVHQQQTYFFFLATFFVAFFAVFFATFFFAAITAS